MKKFKVSLGENVYYAEVDKISNALYKVNINGETLEVEVSEEALKIVAKPRERRYVETSQKVVKAALPGTILKVIVSPGDRVSAGDTLLILEAMKMENEIVAPSSGVVKEIKVSEGQRVETGDILVVLE